MSVILRLFGAIVVLLVGAFASINLSELLSNEPRDNSLPSEGKEARSFRSRLSKFKRPSLPKPKVKRPEVKVEVEWHDMPDMPKPKVKRRLKQVKSALPKPKVRRKAKALASKLPRKRNKKDHAESWKLDWDDHSDCKCEGGSYYHPECRLNYVGEEVTYL